MGFSRLYLDHNASAPLRASARLAVVEALELVGNPSSVHAEGRRAAQVLDDARKAVVALLGGGSEDVVFTSGATEANNLVLASGWDTIFVAGIEHDSVLAPARASAARVVMLPVDSDGRLDIGLLSDIVSANHVAGSHALLTVQAANSETGVLQDLQSAFALARRFGIATHTDAVQHIGRLPLDGRLTGADFVSVSAHKIGGPKGVGALIVGEGLSLKPQLLGGGQQRYRRAGTEAVPLVAGFAAAAREAIGERAAAGQVAALREDLEARLLAHDPACVIIGRDAPRLPNTTAVARPGRPAETTVIALDLAGIAVSAGAACSSGKVGRSAVLTAMGLDPAIASATIRVSLGTSTTRADVERFCDTIAAIWRVGSRRNPLYAGWTGSRPVEPVATPGVEGE